MPERTVSLPLVVALVVALAACAPGADDMAERATDGERSAPAPPAPTELPAPEHDREPTPAPDATDTEPAEPELPPGVRPRPDWLGTRPLPVDEDGFGEVRPTPEELRDRRLPPRPHLAPPTDETFTSSVEPVGDEVRQRSTWRPACPVGLDDLRYVTVTYWGFDERPHTGELLVHAAAADDLVGVFRALHEERFPIEEMRVIAPEELDLPPTGDGNVTTAFVCRPVVGSTSWSQHAYGLAVDINPFHNPYRRGDRVVPELASAYLDREDDRPGMIQPGDVVTRAFAAIGWGWGGDWRSLDDWMHFSASGR